MKWCDELFSLFCVNINKSLGKAKTNSVLVNISGFSTHTTLRAINYCMKEVFIGGNYKWGNS